MRGAVLEYGGLYTHGQNLPYKFKSRMVISKNPTSKNHIENYWSPVRSETGFVILGKFWSRFDLRQRRNLKILGDERTVHVFEFEQLPLVRVMFLTDGNGYEIEIITQFSTPRYQRDVTNPSTTGPYLSSSPLFVF